jgi:hypothetical protein
MNLTWIPLIVMARVTNRAGRLWKAGKGKDYDEEEEEWNPQVRHEHCRVQSWHFCPGDLRIT